MAFVLEELDSLASPLDGAAPQGEDPKYDPQFFELQSEVENIASGRADWEKIEALCKDLLREKAKDLRVVAYFCAALCKRHGLGGLADGLKLLRRLAEDQWEGLHPRRERQRGTALEWILLRVPDYVEEIQVDASDRETLEASLEDLRWLEPSIKQRLGPEAPAFGPLLGVMQKNIKRLPAPEPEEQTPSAENPAAGEASAPQDGSGAAKSAESAPESTKEAEDPPTAPAPVAQAPAASPARRAADAVSLPAAEDLADNATVQEIKNRFRSLIPHLRKADPGSVLAYRVSRLLKWSELSGPPPRDAKKGPDATLVPVPRQQQRDALVNLFGNKQWPLLLEASEAAFQADSGTFWLDLQRFSALALEGMGASEAADVVIGELRQLLDRIPQLSRLSFAGGEVPFAAPETRRWIEESVRKMDIGMIELGGGAAARSMLEEDEAREVAALFAKKNAAGALNLLQEAIVKSPDVGSRFQTRLSAARLCLEANRLAWARNLLEDLTRDARAFDFETWEKETAIQLFHLQALCYGRLAKAADGEEAERLQEDLAEAQARLFRLDLRPIALIEDALGDDAGRGSWWRLRK